MRRILIFATLLIILAAVYQMSQLSEDWHYVVPDRPGELLYATTFDGLMISDWEQGSGPNGAEITDGTLRVFVNEQNQGIRSALEHYYHNFDVSVDATAVDGDENNGYGVIFRQRNDSNYYFFLISSDGYYRVERRVDGQARTLSNWHPSEAINTGIGAINRIRVVGYEDQFQFYVNDQRLELCIPDDPNGISTPNNFTGECIGGQWKSTLQDDSVEFGRVGVTVVVDDQLPAGPVVEFDNVVIYGPQALQEEQE